MKQDRFWFGKWKDDSSATIVLFDRETPLLGGNCGGFTTRFVELFIYDADLNNYVIQTLVATDARKKVRSASISDKQKKLVISEYYALKGIDESKEDAIDRLFSTPRPPLKPVIEPDEITYEAGDDYESGEEMLRSIGDSDSELSMRLSDLDSDTEDYSRDTEEGWFYSDSDDEEPPQST